MSRDTISRGCKLEQNAMAMGTEAEGELARNNPPWLTHSEASCTTNVAG